ncbi:MAG: argininosuccinate lyase [Candidatus Kaelpia aquatica]|nr:argininosuccinate lyase [Candidatus Kaelpia aquatica]
MKEKLWGGRFKEGLDPVILDFTKSIDYDWFLFEYEAYSNIAWVDELQSLKVITQKEKGSIKKAIKELLKEYSDGKIEIDFKEEDIHSFFYSLLRGKVSSLVDKIHAGKSRNEQVVTVMRMFSLDAIHEEIELITKLQKSFLKKIRKYSGSAIPGFTHLQYAQPVLFGHWLLSFVEQLQRDKKRLINCLDGVSLLPLGSGALAGSNFKLNRDKLRKELGFKNVGKNSIDMVSDRDFILEYLNANLTLLLHLSRLAEDLIIYNSPGYGIVYFSDKVTTGSSLMPQKKNPDPVELIRSYSSEALAAYVSMAGILKGLPTSYNRDLQLDKKALLSSYLTTTAVLDAIDIVILNTYLDKERALELLKDEKFYLTDISDELIKCGLSHKEAHQRVGSLLKKAEESKSNIADLEREEVAKILGQDVKIDNFFNVNKSLKRKETNCSTNPRYLLKRLKEWEILLESSDL